jgi:hypothetical protein
MTNKLPEIGKRYKYTWDVTYEAFRSFMTSKSAFVFNKCFEEIPDHFSQEEKKVEEDIDELETAAEAWNMEDTFTVDTENSDSDDLYSKSYSNDQITLRSVKSKNVGEEENRDFRLSKEVEEAKNHLQNFIWNSTGLILPKTNLEEQVAKLIKVRTAAQKLIRELDLIKEDKTDMKEESVDDVQKGIDKTQEEIAGLTDLKEISGYAVKKTEKSLPKYIINDEERYNDSSKQLMCMAEEIEDSGDLIKISIILKSLLKREKQNTKDIDRIKLLIKEK